MAGRKPATPATPRFTRAAVAAGLFPAPDPLWNTPAAASSSASSSAGSSDDGAQRDFWRFRFTVNLEDPPAAGGDDSQPIELRFHQDWQLHPAHRVPISFSGAGVVARAPQPAQFPPLPPGAAGNPLDPVQLYADDTDGDGGSSDSGSNSGSDSSSDGGDPQDGRDRRGLHISLLGLFVCACLLGLALISRKPAPCPDETNGKVVVWRHMREPERMVELLADFAEASVAVQSGMEGNLNSAIMYIHRAVLQRCYHLQVISQDARAVEVCRELLSRDIPWDRVIHDWWGSLGSNTFFRMILALLGWKNDFTWLIDLWRWEKDPYPEMPADDKFPWFDRPENWTALDLFRHVRASNETAGWVVGQLFLVLDENSERTDWFPTERVTELQNLSRWLHNVTTLGDALLSLPLAASPPLEYQQDESIWWEYWGVDSDKLIETQTAPAVEIDRLLGVLRKASYRLDAHLVHIGNIRKEMDAIRERLRGMLAGKGWDTVYTDADGVRIIEHLYAPRISAVRNLIITTYARMVDRHKEVVAGENTILKEKLKWVLEKIREERDEIWREYDDLQRRRQQYFRLYDPWWLND